MSRIKQTGEVFTPTPLVEEILDKLPQELFTNKSKTFLDPACGDGEFLRGVTRRLLKNNIPHKRIITRQVYGVDLMFDNVCDTIYYLHRTTSPSNEENEKITDTLQIISTGFSNDNHDGLTPNEINKLFTQQRIYTDDEGDIFLRAQPDGHHVEYSTNGERWDTVKNIVRADSLTEWNFEEWEPILPEPASEPTIDDFLTF